MYLNAAFASVKQFRDYVGYIKESALIAGNKAFATGKDRGGLLGGSCQFFVRLGLGLGTKCHSGLFWLCRTAAWPTALFCFAIIYVDGEHSHWWYGFTLGGAGLYIASSFLALVFFKGTCLIFRFLAATEAMLRIGTGYVLLDKNQIERLFSDAFKKVGDDKDQQKD